MEIQTNDAMPTVMSDEKVDAMLRDLKSAHPDDEIVDLPLDQVGGAGDIQSRVKIDKKAVTDYANDMRHGDVFPVIEVYRVANEYIVVNGNHTVRAAKLAGATHSRARVRNGDRATATLAAATANKENGLRRSQADRRHAAQMLLNDVGWSQFSDRHLAKLVGVSGKTVGSLRPKALATEESPQLLEVRTAVRKDGTQYSTPISRKGRGASANHGAVEPLSLDQSPIDDLRLVTTETPGAQLLHPVEVEAIDEALPITLWPPKAPNPEDDVEQRSEALTAVSDLDDYEIDDDDRVAAEEVMRQLGLVIKAVGRHSPRRIVASLDRDAHDRLRSWGPNIIGWLEGANVSLPSRIS